MAVRRIDAEGLPAFIVDDKGSDFFRELQGAGAFP